MKQDIHHFFQWDQFWMAQEEEEGSCNPSACPQHFGQHLIYPKL